MIKSHGDELPLLGRPVSNRPRRVAEAIREELSLLLLHRVRDPRLAGVVVASVEMSRDLRRARVFLRYPAGADRAGIEKGLAKARGFMRSHLARSLSLRYTPELRFQEDTRMEAMERLDRILAGLAADGGHDD